MMNAESNGILDHIKDVECDVRNILTSSHKSVMAILTLAIEDVLITRLTSEIAPMMCSFDDAEVTLLNPSIQTSDTLYMVSMMQS